MAAGLAELNCVPHRCSRTHSGGLVQSLPRGIELVPALTTAAHPSRLDAWRTAGLLSPAGPALAPSSQILEVVTALADAPSQVGMLSFATEGRKHPS